MALPPEVESAWLLHAAHVTLLLLGLAGVAALLLPRRTPSAGAPRPAPEPGAPTGAGRRAAHRAGPGTGHERGQVREPHSGHDARVAALRSGLGLLDRAVPTTAPPVRSPRHSQHSQQGQHGQRTRRLLLPLAVVATTTAAGVHAAMGPAHLRESLLFGAFFALTSLAQVAWSALALTRPSAALLRVGAALGALCLALWALTRLHGLPWGLMPRPEAVGAWDLVAVAAELVALACVVLALRADEPLVAPPAWSVWHVVARAGCVACVAVLAAVALLPLLAPTGS